MSESRKGYVEDLFDLVKSMSRVQRQAFRQELDLAEPKSRKGKYSKLFNLLSKAKAFPNYKSLSGLYNSEKALYDSSRYLVSKIFEWTAIRQHEGRWELTMIKNMVEKGFVSAAISVLTKQVYKAWEQKNLFYLRELYIEKEKISNQHSLPLAMFEGVPTMEDVLEEITTLTRSESFYRLFKNATKLQYEERKKVASKNIEAVGKLSFIGFLPTTQIAVLRAKYMLHLLERDFEKFAAYQQRIHKIMLECSELFSVEDLVKEHTLASLLLINEGKFIDAENAILELGSLETENQHLQNRILSNWAYSSIFYSLYTGRMELGRRAIKEFIRMEELYSTTKKAILYHASSMLAAYDGRWEMVVSLQNRLQRMGKNIPPRLLETSFLAKSVAQYELGDFRSAKRELGKFQRATSGYDISYPKAAFEVLQSLMVSTLENEKLLIINFIENIEQLKQDEKEILFLRNFDLSTWAQSKISGKDIGTLVLEDNALAIFSIKLVS